MEVNMETYKKRIKNAQTFIIQPQSSNLPSVILSTHLQGIRKNNWIRMDSSNYTLQKKFNIQNPQNNGLTIEMAHLHEGLGPC